MFLVEMSSEPSTLPESITTILSSGEPLETSCAGGTESRARASRGELPYVKKVRLPDFKEINLSQIEKTPQEVLDLRAQASATIESIFAEKIALIAQTQVDLALGAEDESVRMRAGQKIIEHLKGAPTQRFESKVASVRIVSHMPVPGFEVEPTKLLTSAAVEPELSPPVGKKVLPKFRAASTPASGKSTFRRGPDTNVKTEGQMAPVGDSPKPTELLPHKRLL